MKNTFKRIPLLLLLFTTIANAVCQNSLPDVFSMKNGRKVNSQREWSEKRRKEIIQFYTDSVFGLLPNATKYKQEYEVYEKETLVLGGKAIRKQVILTITNLKGNKIAIDIMVYYPNKKIKNGFPVFVLQEFLGNQSLVSDTLIKIISTPIITGNPEKKGIINNLATSASRGVYARRFPVEMLIDSGYAVVAACFQAFIPDAAQEAKKVMADFYGLNIEQTGTVSVWAWGYSRLVDYVYSDNKLNKYRIGAVGHSRLGKSVLWASVNDSRIGIAFVNESGCTGAKLSKRAKGETIEKMNSVFPYWTNANYKRYNGKDTALAFDQHWLVACMAPRNVYIGNAEDDLWCDPEGEFFSLKEAEKVYNFLNIKTSLPSDFIKAGQFSVTPPCGYHLRKGNHDLLTEDWINFIRFFNNIK